VDDRVVWRQQPAVSVPLETRVLLVWASAPELPDWVGSFISGCLSFPDAAVASSAWAQEATRLSRDAMLGAGLLKPGLKRFERHPEACKGN
jgi:hypothetical protein